MRAANAGTATTMRPRALDRMMPSCARCVDTQRSAVSVLARHSRLWLARQRPRHMVAVSGGTPDAGKRRALLVSNFRTIFPNNL